MKNNFILFSLVSGFACGILWGSFQGFNISVVIFISFLAIVSFFIFLINRQNKIPLFLCLFFITSIFGIFRIDNWIHPKSDQIFSNHINEEVVVLGKIVKIVEERSSGTRLVLEIDEAKVGDEILIPKEKERVVIFSELYAPFEYGDVLEVSGKIRYPEDFETDSGRIFDYVHYLEKDRIYYQMSFADIGLIEKGTGNIILEKLFSLKKSFTKKMESIIPEPEQSLASGILFGDRGFSKKMQDAFIKTGTIHIVALSGYNVMIVANNIIRILSFLPFFIRLWISVGGIALFVLMTGGQATAVRAGAMAILSLLARILGREYDITRGIMLALFLMVLHNPFILAFDVSFQLSFIATIGIIYFTPVVENWFRRIPERFALREIVSTTVAVQIFVLPFLLFVMGIFSITSLPANLLVLPAIPLAMFTSFFTGLIGFVSNIIALPFGFLSYFLLSYVIGVVNLFSKIPLGFFYIKEFPFIIVILFYAFFGYLIWKKNQDLTK